jgi:hypothetical protein
MTDPQLRREFEKLYVYYTGQEFPFPAESGSDASSGTPDSALSQDPQDLIQDILSGSYRKEKKSSGSTAADSGGSAGDSIDEILGNTDSPARKGGNYI